MVIMGAENVDFVHYDTRTSNKDPMLPMAISEHEEATTSDPKQTIFSYQSTVLSEHLNDADLRARERKLLWKIDRRLVPLLIICYFLQYLDKGTIGYASIMGIIKDLNLHDQQYSWANSIFFFGYLLFSYPTSVLIVKFPIGKYVSTTVMVWAALLMLHAAAQNGAGLMAVRFFLGMGEATVVPAFAILIGLFYKREEHPLRQCAFFLGDGIAGITGGLLAYGIAHIHSKVAAWRFLFLIYGAVTLAFGGLLFFTLPSTPETAYFLNEDEKKLAVQRVRNNGNKKTAYKKKQVLEALTDVQAWLLTLNTFCVNIATGGLSSFGYIILQGFGFDLFSTILLTIPGGAAQLIFVGIGAYFGTYVKNARLNTMLFFMVVSITGTGMMFLLPARHKVARVAGSCLTAAFSANLPMTTSLVTSNITGFTKKATVMSMVFVAYCVGRIVGPQFFIDDESPLYRTGLKTIMAVFSIAGLIDIILRLYLMRENGKRDKLSGSSEVEMDPNEDRDLKDLTDKEDLSFRYVL